MIWAKPKIIEVLFSFKHGLFSSHSCILIGLIGFIYLNRIDKYNLLSFFLIFFFPLVYINAATRDWYAGTLSETEDLIACCHSLSSAYRFH